MDASGICPFFSGEICPVSYSYLRDRSINDVYFRAVANSTYDWESWHDPQGKLVWVNDAVERITGYSVEDCQAMADYPLPIIAVNHRERMKQMLDDAIAGKSHNDLEFQISTRDGARRWMAVSWQPMHDSTQKHLGFRTSVRDITDRQGLKDQLKLYTEHLEQLVQERTAKIAQLEQHRQQMEKLAALGELAAGVAHEVNNPLAGIRNAFVLFRENLTPDDEHYDLLELVDKEIERISTIVHHMYQLYRRAPQQPSKLTLEKTLSEVISMLDPIARRHSVTIQVKSAKLGNALRQPTSVTLPEGELKQILFNVLRNAIQASAAEQQVTVTICAEESQVQLEIIDEGTGIPDDVLPHIFEPFFSTKSQIKEGMGLGLSVTRSLIESLHGTIDVETAVGVGSTFHIMLPRKVENSDDD